MSGWTGTGTDRWEDELVGTGVLEHMDDGWGRQVNAGWVEGRKGGRC